MKKIKQIEIGKTEAEIEKALSRYEPFVMAMVLDKMVEIVNRLNELSNLEKKK